MFNLFRKNDSAKTSAVSKTSTESTSSTKTASKTSSKTKTGRKSSSKISSPVKSSTKSKVGRKPKSVKDLQSIINNLGSYIRSSRQAKGWSIKELSESANISTTAILNLESGKGYSSFTSLSRVVPVLGLDWSSIFSSSLMSSSKSSSTSSSFSWESFGLTSSEVKQVMNFIDWIKYQRNIKK